MDQEANFAVAGAITRRPGKVSKEGNRIFELRNLVHLELQTRTTTHQLVETLSSNQLRER